MTAQKKRATREIFYGDDLSTRSEQTRKLILEAIKLGNLDKLLIRIMSWGPITVMLKNDPDHMVHVVDPEELTESELALLAEEERKQRKANKEIDP